MILVIPNHVDITFDYASGSASGTELQTDELLAYERFHRPGFKMRGWRSTELAPKASLDIQLNLVK